MLPRWFVLTAAAVAGSSVCHSQSAKLAGSYPCTTLTAAPMAGAGAVFNAGAGGIVIMPTPGVMMTPTPSALGTLVLDESNYRITAGGAGTFSYDPGSGAIRFSGGPLNLRPARAVSGNGGLAIEIQLSNSSTHTCRDRASESTGAASGTKLRRTGPPNGGWTGKITVELARGLGEVDLGSGKIREQLTAGNRPFRAPNGEVALYDIQTDPNDRWIRIVGTDGRPAGGFSLFLGPRAGSMYGAPALSPDGTKLAFVADELARQEQVNRNPAMALWTGPPTLFVTTRSGRLLGRVTGVERATPVWLSADRLGFVHSGGELQMTDSSARTLSGTRQHGDALAASPDGQSIAMIRGREVWMMNADGSGARKLSPSAQDLGAASFSPDGRAVAVSTGGMGAWNVWIVPVNGPADASTNLQVITDIGAPLQTTGATISWHGDGVGSADQRPARVER